MFWWRHSLISHHSRPSPMTCHESILSIDIRMHIAAQSHCKKQTGFSQGRSGALAAGCKSDNICPQGDSHSWEMSSASMVHAACRKSNVLFPAATVQRNPLLLGTEKPCIIFFLHERHANVVESVCRRFQRKLVPWDIATIWLSKPLTFQHSGTGSFRTPGRLPSYCSLTGCRSGKLTGPAYDCQTN